MSDYENVIHSTNDDRFWYALYTRPRFEKKVDALLKQKDLHSLLPERVVIRQWSNNRRRKIREPLFPSYVFIFADPKERYASLQTHGVARIVSFSGQPTRIPEEQIQAIYRILESGYDPEPYQYLNYGDEVEVVAGPLHGLRGFFIEERGQNRLVISVKAIQQSIAIEVERGQVRRIRSADRRHKKDFISKYRLKLL